MNMKMEWIEPKIEVQKFVAEEYVAACWGVSCDCDAANAVEQRWMLPTSWWWQNAESNYDNGQTHSDDHCGTLTNQWVIDDNDDGTVDRMIETGTDGLGNLTCTLYTNDTYQNTRDFTGIGLGDYIYWTTSAGDRTWHHQGTVIGKDASHPNRS